MMRKYMAGLCLVGLVGIGMATAAWGATPPYGLHFSGKGVNLWNQGSRWVSHGTVTYSFRISNRSYSSKPYLLGFRGTYTAPCSRHPARLFVGEIPIRKDGTFSFRFHDHGIWVKVWGVIRGQTSQVAPNALVDYLANFSKTENLNQNKPGSFACAAWVRGPAGPS